MAEYVQPTYRAVLVPHRQVKVANFDTDDNTITQAGPRPGVPRAQQDTEMTLASSGEQSAAGELRIKIQEAGHPGRDGAASLWQQLGDSDWRGWNLPLAIMGWESIDFTTVLNANQFPHIIRLSDDQAIMCYAERIAGAPAQEHIRTRTMTAARVWGAEVAVYNEDTNGNEFLYPTVLQLPNDRILLFHWTTLSSTAAQVMMRYSDDDGATWTLGSSAVLPLSVSYTNLRRLRCAFSNDQILLIAHVQDSTKTRDDILYQFASDSFGANFSQVSVQTGANTSNSDGFPDIVTMASGDFLVMTVPQSTNRPVTKVLGSAYEDWTSITALEISSADGSASQAGTLFDDGDQALVKDEDGTIYAFLRDPNVSNTGKAFVTIDNGISWSEITESGSPDTYWWNSSDAATYPQNFSCCYQRGRVLMAHNWAANPGNEDDSLGVIQFGGYSTVTLPEFSGAFKGKFVGWQQTWLPFDLPGDITNWTLNETDGTGTEALTNGVLDLHTDAAKVRNYSDGTTTTTAQGFIAMAIWSVDSGQQSLKLETDTGATNDFEIEVRLTTTTIELFDVNAGARVGSTAATSSGVKQQILVAIQDANATLWFRTWTTDEDQEWTEVATTSTLQDDGGGGTPQIVFGKINAGVSAGEWLSVNYIEGALLASGFVDLASGQTNPDDLVARFVSALPVYQDDGVKINALSGPGFHEDDFNIDTRYDFPIENVHWQDAPSPQDMWRSTGTSAEVITYITDANDASDWPSDLLGIYIDNANFSQITVKTEATPGAGFSTTLMTASMKTAVSYGRNGNSVEWIAVDNNSQFYVEDDEYVGCDFMFSATKIREISRNTNGLVSTTQARIPRVYMDDIDDSEPAGVTTGQIINKRALIVIQLAGAQFSGLQITLGTAGSTPAPSAGFIKASTIMIGSVYILGQDPSHNRSVGRIPNVTVSTDPAGRRKTRKRGPARQTFSVNYTEGVETSPVFDATADFILGSDVGSAEAVGTRFDAPMLFRGLQRHLDGPATPFVWIPRLPHLTSATNIFLKERAGEATLVRMIGPLQLDTLLGTEGETEILRIGLTLEEEV